MSRTLTAILLLTPLWLASGCNLLPEAAENEFVGKNAAQLYTMGVTFRRNGNYTKAIEAFDYLEGAFPFDPYAQQGMLEKAYSQHRQEQHVEGILTLNRFIEQNPVHENITYAHYLRGVTYFDYGQTLLHHILPYIRHNKDPTPWKASFTNFSWIVTNDPQSPYAADAQQRTVFLRNLLARYEVHVMDFYLRRKAYVAVINRSKYLLERYHGAPQMADALWFMEQAYRKMGINDLADSADQVRQLNFPHYDAKRAAEETVEDGMFTTAGNWIGDMTDSIASFVGFDIAELPPEDLSHRYKEIDLYVAEVDEYRSAREPAKIVVSSVESGHRPDPSDSDGDAWQKFLTLLGMADDDEEPVPIVPVGEEAEGEAEAEAEEAAPDTGEAPDLETLVESPAEPLEITPDSDPVAEPEQNERIPSAQPPPELPTP